MFSGCPMYLSSPPIVMFWGRCPLFVMETAFTTVTPLAVDCQRGAGERHHEPQQPAIVFIIAEARIF